MCCLNFCLVHVARAVTKALIGGGGAYSYIRVLPDEFLLKSTVMTTDFKRNSLGRKRIYEYPPPSPPINVLVKALHVAQNKSAFGNDLAVTWYTKAFRHLSSLNKNEINEALKWNNCNLIFH